jgi:hypothetical protein
MIKLARVVAVLLVFALAAAQSSAQNWNSVKTLPVGTTIRISVGSRTVGGEVQSVTDDSLAVNSGKGQEMFTRQVITLVSMKKKGHRLRNSMIGLGIGTGAGIGIGLGVGHANDCSSGFLCGIDTAAGGALGGAIGLVGGAVVGALIPTGGWREVYKQ